MSSDDESDETAELDVEAASGDEGDASGTTVVRGRELARLIRRQAYQRAKEARAKDPKFLALKELAKTKRREAGRLAREKKKAAQTVERASEKKEASARRASERARRDEELKKLLTLPRSEGARGSGALAPGAPAGAEGAEGEGEREEHSGIVFRLRSPRSEYDVN